MSDNKIPPRRRHGLFWLIFYAPGAVILWFQYYFPKSGEVWASGRRKGNPIMQLLYSLGFWVALVAFLIGLFTSGASHH